MNMGGRAYVDEDGNVVNGRWLDMLVEGDGVFIVKFSTSLDLLKIVDVTFCWTD